MAPHAPTRRRKLADDLGAQAVSASGDQNLFHECELLVVRAMMVCQEGVVMEVCHPGLDLGSMLANHGCRIKSGMTALQGNHQLSAKL